jgi:hypothetical protein
LELLPKPCLPFKQIPGEGVRGQPNGVLPFGLTFSASKGSLISCLSGDAGRMVGTIRAAPRQQGCPERKSAWGVVPTSPCAPLDLAWHPPHGPPPNCILTCLRLGAPTDVGPELGFWIPLPRHTPHDSLDLFAVQQCTCRTCQTSRHDLHTIYSVIWDAIISLVRNCKLLTRLQELPPSAQVVSR